jgi:hypothetical protein
MSVASVPHDTRLPRRTLASYGYAITKAPPFDRYQFIPASVFESKVPSASTVPLALDGAWARSMLPVKPRTTTKVYPVFGARCVQ